MKQAFAVDFLGELVGLFFQGGMRPSNQLHDINVTYPVSKFINVPDYD